LGNEYGVVDKLWIVPKYVIDDFDKFEEFLDVNNITVATIPPTYSSNLNSEKINSLRFLITAGSESSFNIINKWKNKDMKYINAYGPTEATVCTTA